jgi:hypothetical protein
MEALEKRHMREVTRQFVRNEGPFAEQRQTEQRQASARAPDYFASSELEAQARFSTDPRAQREARRELSKQRARTRAAASKPGKPTVAEWRAHVEERLRALSPEARDQVIWGDWYSGLSERGAQLVDEVLWQLDEEVSKQEAVAEYARLGGAESAQTEELNRWLDDEFAYADELDLEAEAAEITYAADVEAGLDVAS